MSQRRRQFLIKSLRKRIFSTTQMAGSSKIVSLLSENCSIHKENSLWDKITFRPGSSIYSTRLTRFDSIFPLIQKTIWFYSTRLLNYSNSIRIEFSKMNWYSIWLDSKSRYLINTHIWMEYFHKYSKIITKAEKLLKSEKSLQFGWNETNLQ